MTREHAKKILTHLRNGKSDLMLMDALDMAISVLSTEGEYIKKEDLFNKTIKRNSIWNGTTNAEGKGLEEIVNDLPTYSFPDSAEIKRGWIPIEERKPKHKQEVFVTYETEDGIKVDKTEYHERHGFAISPSVTAWREDIKPYKGE